MPWKRFASQCGQIHYALQSAHNRVAHRFGAVGQYLHDPHWVTLRHPLPIGHMLGEKLPSAEELDHIVRELYAFADDETLLSAPRCVELWGAQADA